MGTRHRQARTDRVGARHHAGRPNWRCGIQQRIRPARADGLFPHVRIRSRSQRPFGGARLSQAGDDRRRHRQRTAGSRKRVGVCRGNAARRTRRAGDVDRPRRRCGIVDGIGPKQFGPRLCVGATRQRRNAAPLSGSHRRVCGNGRGQSNPAHTRRRRRRIVERAARTREGRRARRAVSDAACAERGPGACTAGNLV